MKTSIISKLGYTWLSLPREGIIPLTLLEYTEEGIFKTISQNFLGTLASAEIITGNILDLFPQRRKKGISLVMNEPRNCTSFSGKDIISNNSKFDMIFDNKWLIDANIKAELQKANKLLFDFEDPKVLDVNQILLEEHLNIHKPNEKAKGFSEKLKKGKLYVVTEVLQTKMFSVRDASKLELENNGSLKPLVSPVSTEINAELKNESNESNKMYYKNEIPVTFAVKASKILFNEKEQYFSLSKTTLKNIRGNFELLNSETLKDINVINIL